MIKINELSKNFKNNTVLKGLNLEVAANERVALVGQNGSGKTTLIRCLLGLYQFDGKVEIFGTDLSMNREEALMKVAFVPQAPPALKNTVAEIISLTSHLCNFPAERVARIALQLGLDINKCMKTPFKNLSGGMKQKLLIACALARRPMLLIMDEPSANLDPQARSVFFRLLSELPSETTMLLTSHRVDELSGIVSRVIELHDGVIAMDDVVEDAKREVLTEQQNCHLHLKKIPDSVRRSLEEWGFTSHDPQNLIWSGVISSADSFRFHASLTRWSGIIENVSLSTLKKKETINENYNEANSHDHVFSVECLPGDGSNRTERTSVGTRILCPLRNDPE